MTSSAGEHHSEDYSSFMIKLDHRITSDIFYDIKYFLKAEIGEGKMEAFDRPLKLFRELEKQGIIAPENLSGLKDLFQKIHQPELVRMVHDFELFHGASPPSIMLTPKDENYLKVNNYYLGIAEGQHFTRDGREVVKLRSGESYALIIGNANYYRCHCVVKIDGHMVFPSYIISPLEIATLLRPSCSTNKFKFFAIDDAPPESGIDKYKKENGVVEVTFTPEKADMQIICSVENIEVPLTCSFEATDNDLYSMIHSAFQFDKARMTTYYLQFITKPIGKRNIKLIDYGICNGSYVNVVFRLTGGTLFPSTNSTQALTPFTPPIVYKNKAPICLPGATALQGESSQSFNNVQSTFIPDKAKSVTLSLRLFARSDETPLQLSNSERGTVRPLRNGTLTPPPVEDW